MSCGGSLSGISEVGRSTAGIVGTTVLGSLCGAWHASVLPAEANGGKVMVLTRDELTRLQQTLARLDAIRDVPAVQQSPANAATYNLQGIRVADTNRRGVYIKGGKKVIIK